MRRESTEAERRLWLRLRRGSLGVKFRRQQVIGRFIVDFYCRERRLVVEVDGPCHEDRRDRDVERDRTLSTMGLQILRFKNADVVSSIDEVLAPILVAARSPTEKAP